MAIGKPAEKIVLTEIGPDDPTDYYRDEKDVHYVPKHRLEDLIITTDTAADTTEKRKP